MSSQKPKLCMVVEDTLFDRRRIERIFKKFFPAIKVHFAENLANARYRLERTDLSVIFLDNDLPDGKGIDFVAELARGDRSNVPVVMVTDLPSPFMFAKAKAYNVMDTWTKDDFGQESLKGVLRQVGLT